MKRLKQYSMFLVALCFCAGIFLTTGLISQAEEKKNPIPKKVRVYSDAEYIQDLGYWDIPEDYTIRNLKSSSPNLKLKQTRGSISKDGSKVNENKATISCLVKKSGVYTVSFDLYDLSGIKKATKKIKVYAYPDRAVSKVTINGSTDYVQTKKSGVLKVVMNKGYKLKKIEVGKNKVKKSESGKETETVYTTVKNGAKITLNNVPYTYSYESGSPKENYYYKYWTEETAAYTNIRVTFIDKYTKQEEVTTFGFSRNLM